MKDAARLVGTLALAGAILAAGWWVSNALHDVATAVRQAEGITAKIARSFGVE